MAKVLIDSDQCRRTVARIAHEIVEHHPDPSAMALVGLAGLMSRRRRA